MCRRKPKILKFRMNMTPVVTVLTPPLVQCDPSERYRRSSDTLEKK